MHIRPETPADAVPLSALVTAAFETMQYASGTEAQILEGLRAAGALTLSLVAVDDDGTLAGQVAVSPVTVGADTGWFGFGPVAVAPDRQRQGVGSALMNAALERLRADGAKGAVLVGDPAYYGRFGFASRPGLTVAGVPDRNVMALPFGEVVPRGEIAFHPAFGVEGGAHG